MMSLLISEKDSSNKQTTTSSSNSARQWSSHSKNPRIVRVCRSFGGKDRHSKVRTIKGLRDRRIRLSVPTAIQLYDLQNRLGLSQPSKVIDWLLDTSKHDIDKLPPLPMSPQDFTSFHQINTTTTQQQAGFEGPPFLDANLVPFGRHVQQEGININSNNVVEDGNESLMTKLKHWDSNVSVRSSKQQKGSVGNNKFVGDDDDNDNDDEGRIGDPKNASSSQVLAQNLFPIASGSNPMLNYYNQDQLLASNLSLAQTRNNNNEMASQNENNSSPLPSSLSFSSYPSMTNPSLIYPYAHASHHHQGDDESRQINCLHLLNSLPSSLRSSTSLGLKAFFPFSSMSHHHHSHLQQKDDTHDKDDDEQGA